MSASDAVETFGTFSIARVVSSSSALVLNTIGKTGLNVRIVVRVIL